MRRRHVIKPNAFWREIIGDTGSVFHLALPLLHRMDDVVLSLDNLCSVEPPRQLFKILLSTVYHMLEFMSLFRCSCFMLFADAAPLLLKCNRVIRDGEWAPILHSIIA